MQNCPRKAYAILELIPIFNTPPIIVKADAR